MSEKNKQTTVGTRSLYYGLWLCFQVSTGWRSLLSQGRPSPSYLSYFVSWELGLVPAVLEGPPTYGWTEMRVALHLQRGSYDLLPTFKKIVCFPFGYLWRQRWILGGSYVLYLLCQCLLCPWGCFILLGMFAICPGWNMTRYLKGIFFFFFLVPLWS